MKISFILFFLLIVFLSAHSQTASAIEWQNTIGGDSTENFFSVKQTTDGGYILGGLSYSNISGDKKNKLKTKTL